MIGLGSAVLIADKDLMKPGSGPDRGAEEPLRRQEKLGVDFPLGDLNSVKKWKLYTTMT